MVMTYARPHEAGLGSAAKAVGKRLARLLDALGDIDPGVIHEGELTERCWNMRMELIDKLRADGWLVTIPRNNYRVVPPKGGTK